MFDHNFGKINKLTDKTTEGRKKKSKNEGGQQQITAHELKWLRGHWKPNKGSVQDGGGI